MDSKNILHFAILEKNWLDGELQAISSSAFKIEIEYQSDEAVLTKVKSLLRTLHAFGTEDWALVNDETTAIPSWFKDCCSPQMTKNEMSIWLTKWRKLEGAEQLTFEKKKGWSLMDWLYWMQPKNRTWYVFDAVSCSHHKSKLVLLVDSWPVPLGAAEWMLQAAGAEKIEILN